MNTRASQDNQRIHIVVERGQYRELRSQLIRQGIGLSTFFRVIIANYLMKNPRNKGGE